MNFSLLSLSLLVQIFFSEDQAPKWWKGKPPNFPRQNVTSGAFCWAKQDTRTAELQKKGTPPLYGCSNMHVELHTWRNCWWLCMQTAWHSLACNPAHRVEEPLLINRLITSISPSWLLSWYVCGVSQGTPRMKTSSLFILLLFSFPLEEMKEKMASGKVLACFCVNERKALCVWIRPMPTHLSVYLAERWRLF